MKRLRTSVVAWSLAATLASFGALYYLVPFQKLLDFALALSFGMAFAATARYARDAWLAFRSGRSGAEFLIVAVFSIVTVILLQRAWVITLSVYGRPDWLVDSAVTILIPVLISWAVGLALVAPDIDLEPEEIKSSLWKSAALFIGGALAGFVIATSFSAKGIKLTELTMYPHMIDRPPCPPDKPVWVSSKRVYHTESSPYRSMVVPARCYATAADAEAKGFRPPKDRKPAN